MKSLYNLLNSKGQIGSLVLAVLCIVIVLGSIFNGLSGAGYEVGTDLVQILKDPESTQTFEFFNPVIAIPVVLLGVAAFFLVLFAVKSVFSDLKGSIKPLAGVILVLVIFMIFKSMSNADLAGKAAEIAGKQNLSADTIKLIGGGIRTTVMMIGLSILAAVVGGILNIFK